jgi:hypothetical protein
MALLPTVQDINEVDENLRGHYKETDNGFILDVTPTNGYELDNVSGLKSALEKERGLRADLARKAKDFEGMDAGELRSKLTRLEELEALDPSKDVDKLIEAKVGSIKEQLSAKHKKELEAMGDSNKALSSQLQKLLVDDKATQAIISAGGNDKTLAFMLHAVKNQTKVENKDGKLITTVVDSFGNERIGDSNGNPMTVEQLVAEMKSADIWSGAFPGRNKSGGGRPSDSSGGTPSNNGITRSSMTRQEKSDFLNKHGKDAYFALKP